MLRRTFMKLSGLFAGFLSTPALAKASEPVKEPTLAETLAMGNTAEGTPVVVCEHCRARNEMFLDPSVQFRMAINEDELWEELECWFAGHQDFHDQIVAATKKRVLEQHQSVLTAGEPVPLLMRQEQLTYT